MPTIIHSSYGVDMDDATAMPDQVLQGATFYSRNSQEIQTGTLVDRYGAGISFSINVDSLPPKGYQPTPVFTVPSGYYSNQVEVHVDRNFDAKPEEVVQGKFFISACDSGSQIRQGSATVYENQFLNFDNKNSRLLPNGFYKTCVFLTAAIASPEDVLEGVSFIGENQYLEVGTYKRPEIITINFDEADNEVAVDFEHIIGDYAVQWVNNSARNNLGGIVTNKEDREDGSTITISRVNDTPAASSQIKIIAIPV